MRSGDIVVLSGDLGAGKTVLAQGIGTALGVEDAVTSPTFVLIRSHKGRVALHHADMWRLGTLDEMGDLGIAQMVEDGGVAVVEWGERAIPVLGSDYLLVEIDMPCPDEAHQHPRDQHPRDQHPWDDQGRGEPGGEECRRIRMIAVGECWTTRALDLAALATRWTGGAALQ